MTSNQIDQMLEQTLEDRHLSRTEKRALVEVVRSMATGPHERALLQSRVFAIARSAINWYADRQVLDWLEDVIKVLRPFEEQQPASAARAYFSDRDDCSNAIIGLLDGAKRSVDVCVFTITDDRIAKAIVAAHRRKVAVRVVTDDDKCDDRGSDIELFRQMGVLVRVDTSPAHMHHKFAIFDGRMLLTGSYNWTRGAANKNEENFILTEDGRLIRSYAEEFDRLWSRFSATA